MLTSTIFSSQPARAQDISSANLTWSVNNAAKASDSTQFNYGSTFATNGSTIVSWTQGAGANQSVTQYTVSSVSGQWTDTTQDGQAAFNVSNGSAISGTITFSRTSGVYSIHLQTQFKGKPDLDYLFTVSSVNPQ